MSWDWRYDQRRAAHTNCPRSMQALWLFYFSKIVLRLFHLHRCALRLWMVVLASVPLELLLASLISPCSRICEVLPKLSLKDMAIIRLLSLMMQIVEVQNPDGRVEDHLQRPLTPNHPHKVRHNRHRPYWFLSLWIDFRWSQVHCLRFSRWSMWSKCWQGGPI